MPGDKVLKKKLCKWKKSDREKLLDELADLVRPPRYLCKKCGRVARRKANLCKPVPLDD